MHPELTPKFFWDAVKNYDAKKRNGKAGRQKVTAEKYNINDNPSAGCFDVLIV